jgi:hypothetical protein
MEKNWSSMSRRCPRSGSRAIRGAPPSSLKAEIAESRRQAEAAIFSIINTALLCSLPFIEADQIGSGKLVAKLFVRVLENPQINDLHGSE